MKFKKVLAAATVSVMALSSISCRATERYYNELEYIERTTPIRCRLDYGDFWLPGGWEEISEGSYQYIDPEDESNNAYLTVTYETNDYVGDENYQFTCNQHDLICEEFPDATVNTILEGGINDDAGAIYRIDTGDMFIYRWYMVRSGDQVLFEVITDDGELLETEMYEQNELELGIMSFEWNR